MPATVVVNSLTVVHKSSNGTSPAFPDTCKTPSPAGPIPIPYPNIAMSSDTADGAGTVKCDGQPIMLKGSNYAMSSGDEAGSAQGVVSNKIKGKAYPKLHSMDVKADGDNVFRLSDIMLQNGGSPVNTPPGTNLQPPNMAMGDSPAKKDPAELVEAKFSKTKAACGDEVDFEIKVKNYRDSVRIPLKLVLGETSMPLPMENCPRVSGSSAKTTWKVKRGPFAAEKRFKLRALGYFGSRTSSGELEVPTVADVREKIGPSRRSAPQYVQRVIPGRGQVWRPNGKNYGWEYCYELVVQDGLFYVLRKIDFDLKPGAVASESAKARWRSQIESVYTKKFRLHRSDCKRGATCRCPLDQGCCWWQIRFRVQWGAGHGAKIKLFPGACDPTGWGTDRWWYSTTWFVSSAGVSAYVRAHEFGHIVGLYDEYPAGACEGSRLFADVPDSIMNSGNRVYWRHVEEFANWFGDKANSTVGALQAHEA
ncbi:MAG: DUF4150 domain-containing protein [Planctomycetaceae bacterium]|nr:DUF4150 domain-containing protein [Planctomycetaceae bacterium]